MSSSWQILALALVVGFSTTDAFRAKYRATHHTASESVRTSSSSQTDHDSGMKTEAEVAVADSASDTAFETMLSGMVTNLLKDDGPSIHNVMQSALSKMDVRDAEKRVEGKLPADVASLVRLSTSGKHSKHKGFLEASIQKAREILNNMIEEAWGDLDVILIACQEYYMRNRKTYAQVIQDMNRLGSEISDADRRRIGATECIAEEIRIVTSLKAEWEVQKGSYWQQRQADEAELYIKRGDEAVYAFILQLARCKEETAAAAELAQVNKTMTGIQICHVQNGELELNLKNPKEQAKLERMLTPSTRRAFHEVLKRFQAAIPTEFVQIGEKVATTNTSAVTFAAMESPVVEEATPSVNWKKCADGKPNCGLLHDLMAMQWGKFKDLVDELEFEMSQRQDEYESYVAHINALIAGSLERKKECAEQLGEATSQITAWTSERVQKNEERVELARQYGEKLKECNAKISEILFTNICAVRKIRNAVLRHSSTSPLANVNDCAVEDWHNGDCSVPCDDACPNDNPYLCGGWQTLRRGIIVAPNSYGFDCPKLTVVKKCNQIKCPVDCVMSRWEGWSGCTLECGGGTQMRVRNVLTRAKNGGQECDSATESRPCNTMNCDRDCTLNPWVSWSPCSKACNSGLQTRQRTVLIPIRGNGKCPSATSYHRFADQNCNVHDCQGDEICIARQDLILALDGSGSLKEDGFAILRQYAANLTTRYQSSFYGQTDIVMGVVLFGNGILQSDGTIARALKAQSLTSDMADTKAKIEALTWQKGFTNLAQGLAAADTMLEQDGREDCQSAVLVIWDGALNFEFETRTQAQNLKDKNVWVFMEPIMESAGEDDLHFMRTQLASQPWQTNFYRIPGLLDLGSNQEMYMQESIVMFCPHTISPLRVAAEENQRGYMLVRERQFVNRRCSTWWYLGRVSGISDCSNRARSRHSAIHGFAYGDRHPYWRRRNQKHCYGLFFPVSQAQWEGWQQERGDVNPCANRGGMHRNPWWDTYALRPN